MEEKKVYKFFVDGKQFESEQRNITGQQLRIIAQIAPGVGIFLEEHGHNQPDKQITDTTSITLDEKGIDKFYTVPPATFGSR